MDIDINKPMHVCIYLNKKDFKAIQVGTTQMGPHTEMAHNINELMLLFPLSQIDFALNIGSELAREFKLNFEDRVSSIRDVLTRNPFFSDDTIFQQSAAGSLRLLHHIFAPTGNDMGTGRLADDMLESGQQEAFERLGKWVSSNALDIWRNKAVFADERDIIIDLAALSKIATTYDLSYLEDHDREAVVKCRGYVEQLFGTNALRKNPNPRSVAAVLMLRRGENDLDGYPTLRAAVAPARKIASFP